MDMDEHSGEAPGPEDRRRNAERDVGKAALMALTVVAGVGVVLALPRHETGPAAIELARPAPVTAGPLPAWATPVPPGPPEPVTAAPAKAAPAIRTHRLETTQLARPHATPPHVVRVHASAPPREPARPAACRAPATPADRLVCERPTLAAQDLAMRQAYDRALAAGADRLKIDRAQAQWRGRRDRATSEQDLTQLYASRIAELDRAARIRAAPGGAYSL